MISINDIVKKLKPLSSSNNLSNYMTFEEWILEPHFVNESDLKCQMCSNHLPKDKSRISKLINIKNDNIVSPLCFDCNKIIAVYNLINKHTP